MTTSRTGETRAVDKALPEHVQQAVTGILTGMLPDGSGGGDGLNKDDALALAVDLAAWVRGLRQAGGMSADGRLWTMHLRSSVFTLDDCEPVFVAEST